MIRNWLFYRIQGLRQRLNLPVWNPGKEFESSDEAVFDQQSASELGESFLAHRGRTVSKWAHYLDLYDRHFAPFKGRPLSMLEIGVWQGGSLELWRRYFGPDATLCGIDINPACADRVDAPNLVRIGSQDDPVFLRNVVDEIGEPDIVLDDGSHVGRHQYASFRTLWPLLKTGGLYVIEDLHTSYWNPLWEGGYGKPQTGIGLIKQLLDDMHGWYHDRGQRLAPRDEIGAIHAYDSIVFIEKVQRPKPANFVRGGG